MAFVSSINSSLSSASSLFVEQRSLSLSLCISYAVERVCAILMYRLGVKHAFIVRVIEYGHLCVVNVHEGNQEGLSGFEKIRYAWERKKVRIAFHLFSYSLEQEQGVQNVEAQERCINRMFKDACFDTTGFDRSQASVVDMRCLQRLGWARVGLLDLYPASVIPPQNLPDMMQIYHLLEQFKHQVLERIPGYFMAEFVEYVFHYHQCYLRKQEDQNDDFIQTEEECQWQQEQEQDKINHILRLFSLFDFYIANEINQKSVENGLCEQEEALSSCREEEEKAIALRIICKHFMSYIKEMAIWDNEYDDDEQRKQCFLDQLDKLYEGIQLLMRCIQSDANKGQDIKYAKYISHTLIDLKNSLLNDEITWCNVGVCRRVPLQLLSFLSNCYVSNNDIPLAVRIDSKDLSTSLLEDIRLNIGRTRLVVDKCDCSLWKRDKKSLKEVITNMLKDIDLTAIQENIKSLSEANGLGNDVLLGCSDPLHLCESWVEACYQNSDSFSILLGAWMMCRVGGNAQDVPALFSLSHFLCSDSRIQKMLSNSFSEHKVNLSDVQTNISFSESGEMHINVGGKCALYSPQDIADNSSTPSGEGNVAFKFTLSQYDGSLPSSLNTLMSWNMTMA